MLVAHTKLARDANTESLSLLCLVLISQVWPSRSEQHGCGEEFYRAIRRPGHNVRLLCWPEWSELRDIGRRDQGDCRALYVLAIAVARRRPLHRSCLRFPRWHSSSSTRRQRHQQSFAILTWTTAGPCRRPYHDPLRWRTSRTVAATNDNIIGWW